MGSDVVIQSSEIFMAIAGAYAVTFSGAMSAKNTPTPRPTRMLLIFIALLGMGFLTYGSRHAVFCLQPLCDRYWSAFPLVIASQVVLAVVTFSLGIYMITREWRRLGTAEPVVSDNPKMSLEIGFGQTLLWGFSLGMVTAYTIYLALFGVSEGSILMRPWILASL